MPPVKPYQKESRSPRERPEQSAHPYSTVERTIGGHTWITENENTKESRTYIHPSGTHSTIHPDGTKIEYIQGKTVMYHKSGLTVSSDENFDLKVSGHGSIQVEGGVHLEVKGNASVAVAGDAVMAVAKNFGVRAENIYMGASGNFNMNVGGDFKADITGKSTVISDGNMTLGTKGDMVRAADGNMSDKAAKVDHNSAGSQTGSQVVTANRNTSGPPTT